MKSVPYLSNLTPEPEILTTWLICIGFIALTLFISYLTYRFIEQPARHWLRSKTFKD